MTQQAEDATIDQLREELTATTERIETAEVTLGQKALERKSTSATEKELESAVAEARRLRAAISAAEKRDADAEHEAADDAARLERIALYESLRAYLPAVAALSRAHATLKAAEAAKDATPLHPRARRLLINGSERVRIDGVSSQRMLAECELDQVLLRAMPRPDRKPEDLPTPERCAELIARAEELIAAEERGEGETVTLTGPQFVEQRTEQRRQRREENQRLRAEAKAKAEADAKAAAEEAAKRETKAERQARVRAEENAAQDRATEMQLATERERGERQ